MHKELKMRFIFFVNAIYKNTLDKTYLEKLTKDVIILNCMIIKKGFCL